MNLMMLEFNNIHHSFPDSKWELQVPALTLSPRELLGIIGPNGSGKSTLLRIGAGVLSPVRGTVIMRGHNLSKLNRRTVAKYLGYLPQETLSLYDFTVEEIVRLGRYPHTRGLRTLDASDYAAIKESLHFTEMYAFRHRSLSRLSGGEKKRAFLASVLAQKPDILVLDEPTSALDIHHQVQFFRLLQGLARDGMAIVIATHEINLASLFCDRLLILSKGEPVASGPPDQVLTPSTIQFVYGESVLMGHHPETDRPVLFPRVSMEEKSEG
ncbi:MAG: ABC transporter ATP-binding protein [Candidatus Aminicenantes bacterium]|nr:ABC transporter ATP-binding protein [Candidatus Aminicenantes bacterium]